MEAFYYMSFNLSSINLLFLKLYQKKFIYIEYYFFSDSALQECVNIFIQSRRNLVIQSLQFTLEDSVKKFERDHCSLVRSASISLFHLLRDEEALLVKQFLRIYICKDLDYYSKFLFSKKKFFFRENFFLHYLNNQLKIISIPYV